MFFITIDWAIIFLSFFNTISLLWLGLMVLLNGERHRWGTWVGSGGLIMGGLVFLGHSAVVGRALGTHREEMEFWWSVVWVPVIGVSYIWYLVTAWYTQTLRTRRHQIWLSIVSLLAITALALLVPLDLFPTYREVIQRTPDAIVTVGNLPIIALVYPVYSGLCFVLSVLMLGQPEHMDSPTSDLARRRARPWLIVVSLVLFLMNLCFGFAIGWFLHGIQARQLPESALLTLSLLIGLDLTICGLVAIAAVLVGKAIISYEVFGGRMLPSGGLRHHWRSSLILAACYSGLLAWGLEFEIEPIYRLSLVTILITTLYALFSWRSYSYREHTARRLRPFISSQQLYDHLIYSTTPPEIDTSVPLTALCKDVLRAKLAYLVPLGPLAPLVSPVLSSCDNGSAPQSLTLPGLNTLMEQLHSPQTICVPLDPNHYEGAIWAVPLWGERGLIGVLLLGAKQNGDVYTQEEIEIARATGERLIDTQASTELARRLMALQRQRMTESQVLDRQTRRVLHDDVLPQLHTAMLMLSSSPPVENTTRSLEMLSDAHRQIANLLHAMPATSAPDVARLGLLGALRRVTETELSSDFDAIHWHVDTEAEHATSLIPALSAEVIFYAAREAMRNAARYGRGKEPSRPLHLTMTATCQNSQQHGWLLMVEDDGVGINAPSSSAQRSGRGLALHSTMMAVIGGTLTVESEAAHYTRVSLALPLPLVSESSA
jgi:signal transduction histidine kinase